MLNILFTLCLTVCKDITSFELSKLNFVYVSIFFPAVMQQKYDITAFQGAFLPLLWWGEGCVSVVQIERYADI